MFTTAMQEMSLNQSLFIQQLEICLPPILNINKAGKQFCAGG